MREEHEEAGQTRDPSFKHLGRFDIKVLGPYHVAAMPVQDGSQEPDFTLFRPLSDL